MHLSSSLVPSALAFAMAAAAPTPALPHPATGRSIIRRAACLSALLALLVACDQRAAAPPPQPQLAEPLEAAYRQFADPAMTALDGSCDSAPMLAQALTGWVKVVDAAGLQSRFERETTEARSRAAAIRTRCPDAAATAAAPDSRRKRDAKRGPAADPRPDITAGMLEAYARGLDEEIALMQAGGTHFVSLSKYDEQGLQVAATAGLPLPEYRGLRQAMHTVLHELMMHERYAGPAGQARLARLEPHKREYAEKILARDPYASLSAVERTAVRARLDVLRPQYDRYMDLAAIAD